MSQVTSRGCCRAFIICVLWRGWEFVRLRKVEDSPICFPFPENIIQQWIDGARDDCKKAKAFVTIFGGTDFDDDSTYWTLPHHFFTWWKNNIERKVKFGNLVTDAQTKDKNSFSKAEPRARYCRQIIALALNIKNHFDRVVHQNGGRIKQFSLPIEMPSHMVLSPVPTHYEMTSVDKFLQERFPHDDDAPGMENLNSVLPIAVSRPKRHTTRRPKRYYSSDEEEEEEYNFDEDDEDDDSDDKEEEGNEEDENPNRPAVKIITDGGICDITDSDSEEEASHILPKPKIGTKSSSSTSKTSKQQNKRKYNRVISPRSPKKKKKTTAKYQNSSCQAASAESSSSPELKGQSDSIHATGADSMKKRRGRPLKRRVDEERNSNEIIWTVHSPGSQQPQVINRPSPAVNDSHSDANLNQQKKRRFSNSGFESQSSSTSTVHVMTYPCQEDDNQSKEFVFTFESSSDKEEQQAEKIEDDGNNANNKKKKLQEDQIISGKEKNSSNSSNNHRSTREENGSSLSQEMNMKDPFTSGPSSYSAVSSSTAHQELRSSHSLSHSCRYPYPPDSAALNVSVEFLPYLPSHQHQQCHRLSESNHMNQQNPFFMESGNGGLYERKQIMNFYKPNIPKDYRSLPGSSFDFPTYHMLSPSSTSFDDSLEAAFMPLFSTSSCSFPSSQFSWKRDVADLFEEDFMDSTMVLLPELSLLSDQQLGIHPVEHLYPIFMNMPQLATPSSSSNLSMGTTALVVHPPASLHPQMKIATPSLTRSNSLCSHHQSLEDHFNSCGAECSTTSTTTMVRKESFESLQNCSFLEDSFASSREMSFLDDFLSPVPLVKGSHREKKDSSSSSSSRRETEIRAQQHQKMEIDLAASPKKNHSKEEEPTEIEQIRLMNEFSGLLSVVSSSELDPPRPASSFSSSLMSSQHSSSNSLHERFSAGSPNEIVSMKATPPAGEVSMQDFLQCLLPTSSSSSSSSSCTNHNHGNGNGNGHPGHGYRK